MGEFKPKTPVQLNPPKTDPISLEELAKADGEYQVVVTFGSASPSGLAVRCSHAGMAWAPPRIYLYSTFAE